MAGKKQSSAKRKEARARSRVAGEKRKELRRSLQKDAEQTNKALRAEGSLTPWQVAKVKRAEKRKALQ